MIIRKKIRDITTEEFEIWQEHNCKRYGLYCTGCPFKMVQCRDTRNEIPWYKNKEMFSDKFLNQEIDIEVPDILDDAEKRYLSNIIKPFRKKVVGICKNSESNGSQRIIINTIICSLYDRIINAPEYMKLPSFEKDKMYKGMVEERLYTLEELGL